MKKNIAVIYGGDSSEYVVSVKSKANIVASIDPNLFNVYAVELRHGQWFVTKDDEKLADINKADFSCVIDNQKVNFDFAYITIHGTPGEDGTIQAYFDLLKIPYSTGDVRSSGLTFNKFFCSNFLRSFNIPMAKQARLRKGELPNEEVLLKELGLPMFIKPNSGGSSFGVTKVKSQEEILPAIEAALNESDDVLVEEFIEGTEFTCGLVKLQGKKYVFPVTETIPKNEFFDYDAKYNGQVEEITPARLSPAMTKEIQELSSYIYDLCDCRGIARIDFIRKGDVFYFLEVNTTPGMTATSFIPQQIEAMNMTLTNVLTEVIKDGLDSRN